MLILCEKPSVAKEFASVLKAPQISEAVFSNGTTTITHCLGHLLESCDPEYYDSKLKKWEYTSLPIIPLHMVYLPIKERLKLLTIITGLLTVAVKNKEEILIATDAGREGEVIARLVLNYAKISTYDNIYRFWESEALTEQVILRGIKHKAKLAFYDTLANTGLAWKTSDWLFGINMTRLLSLKAKTLRTIGRVQTAVLYELYRREQDRNNFISEDYTELEIVTTEGLKATLVFPDKNETKFPENSNYIKAALTVLQKKKYVQVVSIETKEHIENPPQLYNISELERDAFTLYGFKPEKTLRLAQELYEQHKALSYPRTPSKVMGESNVELVQKIYAEQVKHESNFNAYNINRLGLTNTRLYNNKNLEDHHALIPLTWLPPTETDVYKIWKLVQVRFLMQAMEAKKTEKTVIDYTLNNYKYRGNYTFTAVEGWKKLEIKIKDQNQVKNINTKNNYVSGEVVEIREANIQAKKTKPPEAYNYATILSFMENPKNIEGDKLVGIGTPATRHEILNMLEKRNYTTQLKKNLLLMNEGRALITEVLQHPILEKNSTADATTEWEKLAERNPELLIEKTKEIVTEIVASMEDQMEPVPVEKEVIGLCPSCRGNFYESNKGFYCANYKPENGACETNLYKKILGVTITKEMVKKLLAQGTLGTMQGINKEGVEVTFAITVQNKNIKIVYPENSIKVGICPLCGRSMFQSKKAYNCEGYKDTVKKCEYVLWKDTSGACITREMATELLAGKQLDNVLCKNRENKEYTASLKLKQDGSISKIIGAT